MGSIKGPYNPEFPVGNDVRVATREQLAQFQCGWHLHHPLEPSQFEYAGKKSKVVSISFYHGGDELYTLEGIPGVWHEWCIQACLEVD